MDAYFQILDRAEMLESRAKVLDIGAGGFLGETTTKNLVKIFIPENIVLMDIDDKRLLKMSYIRCPKIHGDFFTYKFEEKFDLISVDLPSGVQFERYWEILTKSNELLKDGGYLLTYEILDMNYISMLSYENHGNIRRHLIRNYESDKLRITDSVLKEFYIDKDFKFISSMPKNSLMQWILLKKN